MLGSRIKVWHGCFPENYYDNDSFLNQNTSQIILGFLCIIVVGVPPSLLKKRPL